MDKIQRDNSIGKILKFLLLLNILIQQYIFYQIFSENKNVFYIYDSILLYTHTYTHVISMYIMHSIM